MAVKISYYVVRDRHGTRRGYWCPTPRMKAAGFSMIACGPDGPEAWAKAAAWSDRWQTHRRRIASDDGARPDLRNDKAGYVYFLKVGDRLKIGFSINPYGRVATLSTGLARPMDTLLVVRGTVAEEKSLHRRFAAYRRKGEWFDAAPIVMRVAMRSLMFGRIMLPETEVAGEQCRSESSTAWP